MSQPFPLAGPFLSTGYLVGTPLDWFDLQMALAPGMREDTRLKQLKVALTYWQGVAASSVPTNLLTANQSDVETDTTGFSSRNAATLTRDTSQFHTGAASLKVVCPAPLGPNSAHFLGVYVPVPVASFTPGTSLVARVWMLGAAGGEQVRTLLWQDTPNRDFIGGSVVLSTSWQEYDFPVTLPQALPSSGNIGILLDTGPSPLAMTWYVDTLSLAGAGVDSLTLLRATYAVSWLTAEIARVTSPPLNTLHIVYPV